MTQKLNILDDKSDELNSVLRTCVVQENFMKKKSLLKIKGYGRLGRWLSR